MGTVLYSMFSNCSIVDPDTWVQYCMFSNLSVVDPDTWVQYCMFSNCSIVDPDTWVLYCRLVTSVLWIRIHGHSIVCLVTAVMYG